jgi:hypothetical protein
VSRKKALSSLWKDSCSVIERQEAEKPNGSTGFVEVAAIENQPCKLSFSTLQATGQNDNDAPIAQTARLFLDNAIQIRAGSKIVVRHCGRVLEFAQSGEPGVFTAHQEIVLAPFRGWA